MRARKERKGKREEEKNDRLTRLNIFISSSVGQSTSNHHVEASTSSGFGSPPLPSPPFTLGGSMFLFPIARLNRLSFALGIGIAPPPPS